MGFRQLFESAMWISDAHLSGTYNQEDRSAQYRDASPDQLLRQLNLAWHRIRVVERERLEAEKAKDQKIAELMAQVKAYRVKSVALTAIITGLAWEGVKALAGWILAIYGLHRI